MSDVDEKPGNIYSIIEETGVEVWGRNKSLINYLKKELNFNDELEIKRAIEDRLNRKVNILWVENN